VEYDDIIVGGGSAGAVLAARLSQDPARRVLLLEAGPDYPTIESTPADLRDSRRMSLRDHDWGMTAEALPGRVIPYPRGRVVGGSSAVNATIALRGVPADYDEWAALGNDEWSWAKVLPYFRRLEDDPTGAAELHGRGGPMTIRRWQSNELIPVQRAFLEVCRRLGFPEVTDHNHPTASGVGPFPQNRRDRLRWSTAIGYLLPARHRPNLTIRPSCLANRVTFADDRAVGVDIGSDGRPEVVHGRRITLATGAIGSPSILLRSGIGPKAALAGLGIDPLTDLPGVGAGLADHPVTRLLLVPKPGSCDPDSPLAQVVLRYTAPGSGEFNDMQQVVFSHVDVAGSLPAPTRESSPGSSSTSRHTCRTCAGSSTVSGSPGTSRTSRRSPATCTESRCSRRRRWVPTAHSRPMCARPSPPSSIPAVLPGWARRAMRWQWSTSTAGSAPSPTCAWSTRQSCPPFPAPTSTSPAS